jgi:hypothetical protein
VPLCFGIIDRIGNLLRVGSTPAIAGMHTPARMSAGSEGASATLGFLMASGKVPGAHESAGG